MTVYLDIFIFITIWLVAQVIFHGFEAHVSFTKRLTKLVVMTSILIAIYAIIGRVAYYAALIILSAGIAVLHGYYFHYRHGIHWRKAEPRDRYLQLIGEMKSSGKGEN